MPRGKPLRVSPGDRYGSWTVVAEADRGKRGERRMLCECDCGRRKPVYLHNLRHGISTGCQGCAARSQFTSHGLSDSPEYGVWKAMRTRCAPGGHPRYAGRGIRVCERWQGEGGFERFYADVGPRPSDKHSIGRIDNDGHYEPGNVRWETAREQARNTCRTTLVVYGRRVILQEVADRHGISRQAIDSRLRSGWTPEECWDYGKGERPPRLRPAPKKDGGARGYRCGECGERGHNRRTCEVRQDAAA